MLNAFMNYFISWTCQASLVLMTTRVFDQTLCCAGSVSALSAQWHRHARHAALKFRVRTILVLGYWVLGNIHRYWVVLLLGDIFSCSDT